MEQLKKMFATHPAPASDAGEAALEAAYAAAQCSLVCTTCADACLSEDAAGHLSECIRLNLDCAELCGATARMLARPGHQDRETLERLLEACTRACRACAEECDSHAEMMKHCRICAETCRSCAEACQAMRGSLVN